MIVVNEAISHPAERTNIASAYPDFDAWAQSGGRLGYDWFEKCGDSLVYPHNE